MAVRNEIRIDRACSAAICEEIGDRLRFAPAPVPDRLPQHLMLLLARIAADQPAVASSAVAK